MSDEGVLARWSRRKLQDPERNALEEQQLTRLDDASPAASEAIDADPQPAPPLTDADMPDIDSLTEESDFSGFMSSGVSDELRNLALRKLFRSAVFNQRDGLDEYDEDYTSFEKLGDIVTSDMKHQMEMEAQKKLEEAEQELLADDGDTDVDPVQQSAERPADLESESPLQPEENPRQHERNEQQGA